MFSVEVLPVVFNHFPSKPAPVQSLRATQTPVPSEKWVPAHTVQAFVAKPYPASHERAFEPEVPHVLMLAPQFSQEAWALRVPAFSHFAPVQVGVTWAAQAADPPATAKLPAVQMAHFLVPEVYPKVALQVKALPASAFSQVAVP